MAKTAVKPDFYANFPSLKRDEELSKKGITVEEKAYYGMALTEGWVLFERDTKRLLEELDSLNDNGVANGLSYEELGKNTVVVSLVKGIVKKLVEKVLDSKEACETGGQ